MNQVTLDELLSSLKERSVRMPADIGAFIALEAIEAQLAASPRGEVVQAPQGLTLERVVVTDEGEIGVAEGGACDAAQAAQAVTQLLGALLVAAGTGVPSAMVQLVETPPPTGTGALEALRDQIEAALVPLNRDAARRVLSRMIRESRKPVAERADASNDAFDDAVDALVGGEKLPPSPKLDPMIAKVAEDHAAQRNDSPDTLSDDVQPTRAPREVDLGPARDEKSIPWALILFVVLVAGATVWVMQNRRTFFPERETSNSTERETNNFIQGARVPSSATPSSATPSSATP